jgi:Na+-translocating ferredoxin:NAD+ oxidoreductase RnfC subunit
MPDLVEIVKNAGVIGAGGAGFPTHIKISGKPQTLIINGAECEPLIYVDRYLLRHEKETLISGLTALTEHLQPTEIYLGLKHKNVQLLHQWTEILKPLNASVVPLDDFYPAGDEQILVYEATGKVVPPGGIPLDVGTLVLNVETLFNIGRAVAGYAVTDKYLTVTGAVRQAGTFRVPVGTRYGDLLERAGGMTEEDCVFLAGGPMMGKIVHDVDDCVSKATKAFIVLPKRLQFISKMLASWENTVRRSKSSCELCQMCTDMCPRFLLGHPLKPHAFMRLTNYVKDLDTVPPEAFLCVECGICENFACPVNISPRTVIKKVKELAREKGFRYMKGTGYSGVKGMRDFRKVPYKRLVQRLGLAAYDELPATFRNEWVAPVEVKLPLKPPFGATRVPVVELGQIVRKGDLVADIPGEELSSKIHASIDGRVTGLTAGFIAIRREEMQDEKV